MADHPPHRPNPAHPAIGSPDSDDGPAPEAAPFVSQMVLDAVAIRRA